MREMEPLEIKVMRGERGRSEGEKRTRQTNKWTKNRVIKSKSECYVVLRSLSFNSSCREGGRFREMNDRDKQKQKVFRIQLALPLLVRPGQGWQQEGNAGRPTRTYIFSSLWQVTCPLTCRRIIGWETVDIYRGLFTTHWLNYSLTKWMHLNISANRSETYSIISTRAVTQKLSQQLLSSNGIIKPECQKFFLQQNLKATFVGLEICDNSHDALLGGEGSTMMDTPVDGTLPQILHPPTSGPLHYRELPQTGLGL